jgi:hypothetical protein
VLREVYELEERAHLIAMRKGIFDMPARTKAKVHPETESAPRIGGRAESDSTSSIGRWFDTGAEEKIQLLERAP